MKLIKKVGYNYREATESDIVHRRTCGFCAHCRIITGHIRISYRCIIHNIPTAPDYTCDRYIHYLNYKSSMPTYKSRSERIGLYDEMKINVKIL